MASWDFVQKQILLGDAATGKSSLLVRLTDDRFLQHSEPTIGCEFGAKVVTLLDEAGVDSGKKVKLQIWDTAGQESFRSITRSYYRGAGGALLVFDIAQRDSFEACGSWLQDLRTWGEEDVCVLLVGNKADLVDGEDEGEGEGEGEGGRGTEHEQESAAAGAETSDGPPRTRTRQVKRSEARLWVQENGLAGYVETSAKSGQGVDAAFDALTREVHQRQQANRASARNAANATGSGRGSSLPGAFKLGRGTAGTSANGCC